MFPGKCVVCARFLKMGFLGKDRLGVSPSHELRRAMARLGDQH